MRWNSSMGLAPCADSVVECSAARALYHGFCFGGDQLRGLSGVGALSGTTDSLFFFCAILVASFFGAAALAGALLAGLAAALGGGDGGGGGGLARFFCCSRSVTRSDSSFFCSSVFKGLASRVGR